MIDGGSEDPASVWRDTSASAEIAFYGKGGPPLAQPPVPGAATAWLEQIHGRAVRLARPGWSGRGDALISRRATIVPLVVTADCVPVLLAGAGTVAAVHAGWRGIARGAIAAALARMADDPPRRAWIGPAIGPCCYEVSDAVARAVSDAASTAVVVAGRRARPHLDLSAAVGIQLEVGGVRDVRRLGPCTRCAPDRLWSYRRDGAGAGRNVAMIRLRS